MISRSSISIRRLSSLIYTGPQALHLSLDQQQTIFALCTGSSQSSISVWRISGPDARSIVESICPDLRSGLRPRHAHLVRLKDNYHEMDIDQGLCLYFPGPHSYTGQDVIELHTHSSPAVIQHLYDIFNRYPTAREAKHGEFTRRALANGKMDLLQVEGLADLMSSYTLSQKKQALQQVFGAQSSQIEKWRRQIITILAHMEAHIDFGQDEDDIDEDHVLSTCINQVEQLVGEIKEQLVDSNCGELIREGINVAIVGECNVGKSSLLNHLIKQDVSIVTSIPGTTRDVVEKNMFLNGVAVKLADTAGFRDTDDVVEVAGIRLSSKRLHQCQLAIVVLDATSPTLTHPVLVNFLFDVQSGQCKTPVIIVLNKTDLVQQTDIERIRHQIQDRFGQFDMIPVSIRTDYNTADVVNAVSAQISQIIKSVETHGDEPLVVTRQRHRSLLQQAVSALQNFRSSNHLGLDARTEDLRIAVSHLAQLTSTGHIHNDEVIDTIFRDFCIGK